MNKEFVPVETGGCAPPVYVEAEVRQAYRPKNTPWVAKRKGTERLVWYLILDSEGEEMCNTGSVLLDEERAMLAQVFLILTAVNGTDAVEIDGKMVKVEWR